jgi:hypothetical protein
VPGPARPCPGSPEGLGRTRAASGLQPRSVMKPALVWTGSPARSGGSLDRATTERYRTVMRALLAARTPFLVGGAYALERYTGIARHTKDFDIFVREPDVDAVLEVLRGIGCRTEIRFPHWLAKAWYGEDFIDVIFSSGNGVAVVDDEWFAHAVSAEVLGVPVQIIPAEEMIWSKGFIMERERYDGADVAHLLGACAERLDWDRLLRRFAGRWRVLLVHLVMFGFIYPAERDRIPPRVMRTLFARLAADMIGGREGGGLDPVCHGTLVSRQQYLPDLARGYADARLQGDVRMSEADVLLWTSGIAVDGESGEG